jgi:hypothetical protein
MRKQIAQHAIRARRVTQSKRQMYLSVMKKARQNETQLIRKNVNKIDYIAAK